MATITLLLVAYGQYTDFDIVSSLVVLSPTT